MSSRHAPVKSCLRIVASDVCHTDAFTLSGDDPGSAFGGVKGRTELPACVEQAHKGEIPLDVYITHAMPLEEINTAVDLMHAGKSIRTVFHF